MISNSNFNHFISLLNLPPFLKTITSVLLVFAIRLHSMQQLCGEYKLFCNSLSAICIYQQNNESSFMSTSRHKLLIHSFSKSSHLKTIENSMVDNGSPCKTSFPRQKMSENSHLKVHRAKKFILLRFYNWKSKITKYKKSKRKVRNQMTKLKVQTH